MAVDLATLIPALGQMRRDRGAIRPMYPEGVELRFARAITKLVRPLKATVLLVLDRARPLFATNPNRVDAADLRLDEGRGRSAPAAVRSRIGRVVDVGREAYTRAVPRRTVTQVARSGAEAVNKTNRAQVKLQLGTRLAVDVFKSEPWLGDVVSGVVNETVSRITAIPDRFYGRLEDQLADGYMRGLRHEDIAARIARDFIEEGGELGIASRRAGTIARDVVGSLNGRLTKERHLAAGVERFFWRTALDERVRGNPAGHYPDARPSHFAREGKIYSYDDPPDGEIPGSPILCRCVAQPYLQEAGDTEQDQEPGDFADDPRSFLRF